jgi:hypothetical protein
MKKAPRLGGACYDITSVRFLDAVWSIRQFAINQLAINQLAINQQSNCG